MLKKLLWSYLEWRDGYPGFREIRHYSTKTSAPPVLVETVNAYIAHKGDLDDTADQLHCSRERVKQRLLKYKRLYNAQTS